MNLRNLILIFYLAYTLYVLLLVGVTTMTFYKSTLAVLLMWINYIFFSFGYSLINKNKVLSIPPKTKRSPWLLRQRNIFLIFISLLSLFFSFLAVEFYTGQTPNDVFSNLASNVSVYYEYQNYFSSENLNVFSINKIPYILMIFFVKILLLYSYMSMFKTNFKRTAFHYIYIFIITFSHVYIALGRGTNFEYFELLILVIYLLFKKSERVEKHSISFKPIIISSFLIILGMYIFIEGINARGVQFNVYNISPDVNYDSNGWLSINAPFLSTIVFRFYGYFGFGFFYVSSYVTEVWFSSLSNFISGMMPMGYKLYNGEELQQIMNSVVHVGVKWHPDFSVFINNLGYLGLIILCVLLGAMAKYFSLIEAGNPIVDLTNYVLLLQVISLPVGNFLFTSSANQLILITLLIYWIWRLFIHRRITLN